MGYNGYTEKKKISNSKYMSKFCQISFRATPEQRTAISLAAQECGKSMTQYIIDCCLPNAGTAPETTDR